MTLKNLIYSILPSEKRQQLKNKKNVEIINEFLRERKKLQAARDDDLLRLRQLRKDRSINTSMYDRLKHVMIITHEQKRIELIESITKKTEKNGNSVKVPRLQLSEDAQMRDLDLQSVNQAN
jgi:hypothetical protein